MTGKDNWDKFEVVSKLIGSVVLVAIPIVIKYSADNIARSMQQGQLIQSLTTQLVERDAKRDIALIALSAAMPDKKKCYVFWIWGCQNDLDPKKLEEDQVLEIAEVLVSRTIADAKTKPLDQSEINVARQIIIRRTNQKYYQDKFESIGTKNRETSNQYLKSTPEEIASKAKVSEALNAIQPPQSTIPKAVDISDLDGIRLVYIQYQGNKEQAEKLQQDLKALGISVPGIEKVNEIKQNDIRYASAADKQLADKLKGFLDKKGIKVDTLIDLSKSGYRASSGQVEIWLKD